MNPFHSFLRIFQGVTEVAMWDELTRLRRLGVAWEGVPQDEAEFTAGLQRLVDAGWAERSGALVLWLPVKPKPAERTLFA